MENMYDFILHNGKKMRGFKLFWYVWDVMKPLFGRLVIYLLLSGMYYFIEEMCPFTFVFEPAVLLDVKHMDESAVFTLIFLVMVFLSAWQALKCVFFLLVLWFVSYSCECQVLESEKKYGNCCVIHKIKVNGEEYTTSLFLNSTMYRRMDKNKRMVTFATNRLNGRCLIE